MKKKYIKPRLTVISDISKLETIKQRNHTNALNSRGAIVEVKYASDEELRKKTK